MKNKLLRFAENKTFGNVIQPTRQEVLNQLQQKGNWANSLFNNNHPIVLELGCGKGEYTTGLAKQNPNINYIGIDLKGARFWRGAKTAAQENLTNVAFIRTQIELIDEVFAPNEISEIWITFPDPQIKYRRTKHRLTHPLFLTKYNKILCNNGKIHLKTDSEFLHGYTHGIIQMQEHKLITSSHNAYHPKNSNVPPEVTNIQTFYEKVFLEEGKLITYIQFQLNPKYL